MAKATDPIVCCIPTFLPLRNVAELTTNTSIRFACIRTGSSLHTAAENSLSISNGLFLSNGKASAALPASRLWGTHRDYRNVHMNRFTEFVLTWAQANVRLVKRWVPCLHSYCTT